MVDSVQYYLQLHLIAVPWDSCAFIHLTCLDKSFFCDMAAHNTMHFKHFFVMFNFVPPNANSVIVSSNYCSTSDNSCYMHNFINEMAIGMPSVLCWMYTTGVGTFCLLWRFLQYWKMFCKTSVIMAISVLKKSLKWDAIFEIKYIGHIAVKLVAYYRMLPCFHWK